MFTIAAEVNDEAGGLAGSLGEKEIVEVAVRLSGNLFEISERTVSRRHPCRDVTRTEIGTR